jgi:uncharacterized protein YbjT (DUF2867 family)
MDNKIIAVTGAAGQQGGAVSRKLLAEGWKVRALTRDPQKPMAIELAALGAEILAGDMDRLPELEQAFEGAHGVFSVQNYWIPSVGFDGEVRQGKAVADAAKAAGVAHLVYSSVGAAHRGMGQKHFESKWIIEQHIQTLSIPSTILRPVAFYENFSRQRADILNGRFEGMGLRPEKERQMIAVEDIAVFAAVAFADPKTFPGRTIELAGDSLTESQIAEIFAKVIGRPVALRVGSGRRPGSEEEMKAMFAFFNGQAYDADIPALRKIHPGLLTFEQYLRKSGWENARPIPLPEQSKGA